MKQRRRGLIILAAFTLAVFISGCWDYREIDEQMIVAGVAVDDDKESQGVKLTAEMAVPASNGKENSFNSTTYEGKGANLLEAAVDLRSKAGETLMWSHTKVLILGKGLMEKKDYLVGVMDWIKRNHKMRDTVWVLSAQEKTGGEILRKSKSETQKIISYYLDRLLLAPKSETFLRVSFAKFLNELQSNTACAAIPEVCLDNSGAETLPNINGTALFHQNIQVGRLDAQQTKILLLLRNSLSGAVLAPVPSQRQKVQAVSLRIMQSKTAMRPVLRRKRLQMEIKIQIEASIAEIDGENDVFKPAQIKKLAGEFQSIITDQIKELLNRLQRNYQCDALGFGAQVEAGYPDVWRQCQADWPQVFAKIPNVIRVKINITGSEQSMKETKAGH